MTRVIEMTKITIGDSALWFRPFGKDKVMISANDPDMIEMLGDCHMNCPDLFDTLVDDEDLCSEDLQNTFSVIIDPKEVDFVISFVDAGDFGFRIRNPFFHENGGAE